MVATTTALNIDEIRSSFPALSRINDQQRPVVYLDSPGGTQVPDSVIKAVSHYYRSSNSNIEGEFDISISTDVLIEKARQYGGWFVGGEPEGIIFGQNATTLNFSLSRAFGRSLVAGDEIVVTSLDHDANVAPWLLLARDLGLIVRTVGLTATTEIDLDALREAVGQRTKVVAFTLASNAVGTLSQAVEIVDIAHEAGAIAWADGVAYAAHRRIDVRRLGVDVLLTSPYKYFGPHLGMAWIRPEFATKLTPDRARPASLEPVGHRFETGTLSHEAIAGFTAAVDYLAGLGEGESIVAQLDDAFRRIREHEESLTERLYTGLSGIRGLQIVGVPGGEHGRRLGTVSAIVEGGGSARLARELGYRGVLTWNGSFYAQGVMEHLGLNMDEGLLRFGVIHYNSVDDVDRAIATVKELMQ